MRTVAEVELEEVYRIMKSKDFPYYLMTENIDKFSSNIPISELGIFLDWDDTLTEPGINNNSWQIMDNAFSKVGSTKDIQRLWKARKHYHDIEKERPLTSKEMKEWQKFNLAMYVENGLKHSCLTRQIKSARMYLIAAVIMKYLLCHDAKVCIVSSGVKQVIEMTLRRYGINPDKYPNLQINATDVVFEGNHMVGWDFNSIVTAKRKPIIVHSFSRIWDIKHENVFVIGDGNTDLNMLENLSKDAKMIFFCPAHKQESLTREKFDLISQTAQGFVKQDFGIIAEYFMEIGQV
jgi:phosphoserine phosphatase